MSKKPAYGPPSETMVWVKTTAKRYDLAMIDQAAVDATRRKALSPSTAKSMKGCVARWAFEKLYPTEQGEFDPAPMGTSVHEVLEFYYALPPEERTLAKLHELIRERGIKVLGSEEHQDFRRWEEQCRASALGLLQIENPVDVDVVSLEQDMETVIDGVPFRGIADRITRDPNGDLVVGDYKTGKKRYEYPDQLRIYKKAVETIRPELKISRGELIYTKLGEADQAVDVSDKAMKRTLDDFKKSWEKHNKVHATGVYPTKVDGLCSWCPLVNSCPMAEAAEKFPSDRLVVQPEGREQLGIRVIQERLQRGHSLIESTEDLEDNNEENADMATSKTKSKPKAQEASVPARSEDKPWEVENAEGELNLNSYVATGLYGLFSASVKQLRTAADGRAPITADDIQALMDTFALIVADVQEATTGTRDPQLGVATRLRGVLFTHLDTNPFPLGSEADDMDAWVESAKAIMAISVEMVDNVYNEPPAAGTTPWDALLPADEEEN